MDIRVVARPELWPAQCMFTGGNGECLDLLRDFTPVHEGRMYISTVYAREIGAAVGLADPQLLQEEIDRLRSVVDEQTVELERLHAFEEAAEYTLSHWDRKVRKKPGPKGPRKLEEVA